MKGDFVMIPMCRALVLSFIILILLKITALGGDTLTAPKSVELICEVGHVSALPGNQNIMIPVYLTNVFDSVQACQLWIVAEDPSIVRFMVDSVGGLLFGRVDTVGTRSSGALVSARIFDPLHAILTVSIYFPSPNSCIPPGSGVLINLIAEADSAIAGQPTVIIRQERGQTQFSSRYGETIGCVYDSLGQCTIDTTKRVLMDGEVEVAVPPTCICGDANGDGIIDVSDVVCLIAYIFSIDPIMGCTPVDCLYPRGGGDANGDGTADISDGVSLIAYIFSGGPTPHCHKE
jgi:hypothetical protein